MQQRIIMPLGMILLGLTALAHSSCRKGKTAVGNDTRFNQDSVPGSGLQTTASSDAQAGVAKAPSRASCSRNVPYKIVGGQSATENSQVAAATVKLIIRNQKYCTATLIGDHHLVTAAHCVADVKDPAAELKIGSGLDGKIQDKLLVDGLQVHPQYQGILGDEQGYLEVPFYDVAAIHFKGPLPAGLGPVSIAGPTEIQAGMPTIVSGYGAYGGDDKTRRPLSVVESRLKQISTALLELQLASGEGRGACFGDSGGPTYIVDPASSCLLLIGSTTGPGRDTDYTCETGGGTLMDLTRYQSWLACAFKNLNQPLDGLITNLATAAACDSK